MDKFLDIITAIKNQQPVNPPGALVDQVMARIDKVDHITIGSIQRFLFRPQKNSQDVTAVFSGRITSYQQCAFLLLLVGFFYLVAGMVAIWGLHDVMAGEEINLWLKMQPYFTLGSGILIICAALLIFQRYQATAFVQYVLIVHTIFVMVNAFILESILSFPFALMYTLILTVMAVVFGVLLIGSIRSVLKFRTIHEGRHCA